VLQTETRTAPDVNPTHTLSSEPTSPAPSAARRIALATLWLCYACDGATPETSAPAEPEPVSDYVLYAELPERPAAFPSEHVRAALAWIDGRPLDAPETASPDDLRELRFELSSDVRVDVSFPLRVRIPIQAVEPMHYQWLAFLADPDALNRFGAAAGDRYVNSLPQAEVVVYFDANHNRRLDLLEPGEPGPAPDRILAVGSGRDARGQAVRHVVIHKRAPIEPPLELFIQDWGPARAADGLYLVHISVAPELPLAQDALLETHGITTSNTFDKYWVRNIAQRDFTYAVSSLEQAAPIPLFAVEEARRSWLARGCVPYPTGRLGYAKPPPRGAAVQCGADMLSYASHPDDYCGQGDTLSRLDFHGSPDLAWWPCDEHGLIAGSDYVEAHAPLGTSILSMRNSKAYTGVAWYEPPADFRCQPDVIYDFDDDPRTHLPAQPPPPDSQVLCYGHDALSFIPDDPACKRKFTYDLSSDAIPGYTRDGALHWDMHTDPPAWWPCDADGQLIAEAPYKAPERLDSARADGAPCPDAPALAALGGTYPPPPHTKIRCTSASSLVAVPLWSDRCDGRTELALRGEAQSAPIRTSGWKQDAPAAWPCDAEGNFIPTPGYESL